MNIIEGTLLDVNEVPISKKSGDPGHEAFAKHSPIFDQKVTHTITKKKTRGSNREDLFLIDMCFDLSLF